MYSPVNLRKELFFFAALFLCLSLALFWIMNGGAYYNEIRYTVRQFWGAEDALPTEGSISDLKPRASAAATTSVLSSVTAATSTTDLILTIPKIQVNVPIIAPPNDTMKEILGSLEKGVGLFPGSNLPGQGGRGVILGHSSRASWYRGNYAYIFSLLPKLEVGDVFYITQGHTRYVYKIFAKSYIPPAEMNVILAGPANGSEIDLVTCYPIGSAAKRNFVQARLIRAETI